MAVRLWRAIRSIIMSRRRKSRVNYREFHDESSDDDFSPSLKKSKQPTTKKYTRLSRDDKQLEKDTCKAMLASQKNVTIPDTSLVVVNEHAEMDSSYDNSVVHHGDNSHHDDDSSYSVEPDSDKGKSSSDDSERIDKPLIKERTKRKKVKKRSQIKQTEKENTSPDPTPTNIPLQDPLYTPEGTVVSPIVPAEKQIKQPFWKPPSKAGASPSPLVTSTYAPTPGIIGNQSGSGMRVGLSRNVRVKSLHQNIKTT